jgi:hypothetical protein
MSSHETGPNAAQVPDTSLLTQLVLEVYLAAWTRTALDDEERLPPVATSPDEGGGGEADEMSDLDHFGCPSPRRHISVRRMTDLRYVEARLLVPRRRRVLRACLQGHRGGAPAAMARAGLRPTNHWKGG